MIIGGLQKFTTLDYPDKISAVIFTVGCNFRCPYCHNPELVIKNKETQIFSEEEILDFLENRKDRLEGVCISGGEPTLQKDIIDFVKKINEMGFSVKLDTNGSNPGVVEKILSEDLVDYFAIDVKTAFHKYSLVDGFVLGEKSLETIDMIIQKGKRLELRTTVAPKVVTSLDFDNIINELNKKNEDILKNIFRYSLQNFRPQKTLNPEFSYLEPYSEDIMQEISLKLKKYCKRVDIF